MKKQAKFYESIPGVALVTLGVLLVPWVAMQFTNDVVWDETDFIIVGILLFATGLSYKLVTRSTTNIIYRIAAGLALGTALFMVWANLAVGLIGSGPNPGNLMYIGVLAVAIIGAVVSRFRPAGMEHALYATALALVLVAVIALFAGMQQYPGSSVTEILGVNGLFAALFVVSGLLFRNAARHRVTS